MLLMCGKTDTSMLQYTRDKFVLIAAYLFPSFETLYRTALLLVIKKKQQMMTKMTGIWIDKRTAKIVNRSGDAEEYQTIQSGIEEYHPKGGSGTSLKGGPQDVVQDSKYLERIKHQQQSFFKNIAKNIEDSDAIVIFGPAQTGEKLHRELSESYPEIHKKVRGLEKADSMTNNQVKAWVRDYFSK